MPSGWTVSKVQSIRLDPLALGSVRFTVQPPAGFAERRARVAVDVTMDGKRFGQQAEALVSAPGK